METLTLIEIPVCSQAEAVEKFSLRKCSSNSSQEKLGVSTSFFAGKLTKSEKCSCWLERINRNEEGFNGEQTGCA